MKTIITSLLTVMALLLSLDMYGQTWIKRDTNIRYGCIIGTRDGNMVVVGDSAEGGHNYFHTGFIEKIDMAGNYIWRKEWADSVTFVSVSETSDSGFIAVVGNDSAGAYYFTLVRYDKNGNELWSKWYNYADSLNYCQIQQVIQNNDGGFTAIGEVSGTSLPAPGIQLKFMVRTDANGDTLWTWKATNPNDVPGSVVQSYDGGYVMAGALAVSEQMYLDKIDSNGHLVWERIYNTGTYTDRVNVIATPDNGYLLTGSGGVFPYIVGQNPYLLKTDVNGDSLWSRMINRGPEEIFSSSAAPDGGYYLLLNNEPGGEIIVIKLNNSFDSISTQHFRLTNLFFEGSTITSLANGGFAVIGMPYDNNHPFENQSVIFKSDGNGTFMPNIVKGYVYQDVNNNCVRDTGDIDLPNKLIQLHGSNNYYDASDLHGAYQIIADSGAYHISYNNLDPFWKLDSCNLAALSVHFPSIFDTAIIDVPLTPVVNCPDLSVHVSTILVRRCFATTYNIAYENTGSAVANNAYITLDFDSFLNVNSSSLLWASYNGQLYRFDLGNVQPGASGGFTVNVMVNCASQLGQTHCVTAHIYPDSSCFAPDSLWDEASIEVKAQCLNQDSVDLEIHNNGTGNMQQSLNYYIVEDNVMFRVGQFQLPAGQSHHEKVAANGSTWTLIAEQSKHHPGFSAPLISIEGCGRNSANQFSKGFVTQFPLDDQDDFIDIICTQNRGPFDPNEKSVSPEGLTANGYISKEQVLQYQIDFQNTGTDTAMKVVVKDTLSLLVDVTTLQLGVSSHPYSFAILDSNILLFTFDTIMLPDSNINEPASHAFVTYSIAQKPNNQQGSVIMNQASIYFDYNAPIVTNTTINTIADDYKQWLAVEELARDEKITSRLFPNPTKGNVTLLLQGIENSENITLQIFDLNGHLMDKYILQGNGIHAISNLNLPQGMYLYQISTAAKKTGMGKIMVYE